MGLFFSPASRRGAPHSNSTGWCGKPTRDFVPHVISEAGLFAVRLRARSLTGRREDCRRWLSLPWNDRHADPNRCVLVARPTPMFSSSVDSGRTPCKERCEGSLNCSQTNDVVPRPRHVNLSPIRASGETKQHTVMAATPRRQSPRQQPRADDEARKPRDLPARPGRGAGGIATSASGCRACMLRLDQRE